MEITPEYQLTEFLSDFSYNDEYMNEIVFAEEAQKTLSDCIKACRMQKKKASFSIKINIKPYKQNHVEIAAELANIDIPKPSPEPAILFVDARMKLHKHGNPDQLRLGEEKVTKLNKKGEK